MASGRSYSATYKYGCRRVSEGSVLAPKSLRKQGHALMKDCTPYTIQKAVFGVNMEHLERMAKQNAHKHENAVTRCVVNEARLTEEIGKLNAATVDQTDPVVIEKAAKKIKDNTAARAASLLERAREQAIVDSFLDPIKALHREAMSFMQSVCPAEG